MINKLEKLLKAKNYALEKKGMCLSTEYVSCYKKLEWKCSNLNHLSWFSTFSSTVSNKTWCMVCGIERMVEKRKNQNGLKEARQYAIAKGGACLSTEYVNCDKKLEWKCSNNNHPSWFSALDTVINNKTWCAKCAFEEKIDIIRKNGLKQAQQYAATRGGICLSAEYMDRNTKMEWKCKHHKSWFATYRSVLGKQSWCPECGNNGVLEFKVRNILNYLLDTDFIKNNSLSWNINPITKKNLELDGYSGNLKIAFEFQGPHHKNLIFNNKISDLKYIVYKDKIKKINCTNNGVKLIIIDDKRTKTFDVFYEELLRAIKKAKIKINEDRENNLLKIKELYDLNPKNSRSENFLKKAQDHALTKNGKCLSTSYKNNSEKLDWKCSNSDHPLWSAAYYSVVQYNSWCKKCYREKGQIK